MSMGRNSRQRPFLGSERLLGQDQRVKLSAPEAVRYWLAAASILLVRRANAPFTANFQTNVISRGSDALTELAVA